MRDIVTDKAAGRVWAKVGEKNSLKIRSVEIAAEVFTVLEGGQRAGLSVCRLTQERGAKSSFERVVGALEGVLRARGVLVAEEEGEKVRGMKAVLEV